MMHYHKSKTALFTDYQMKVVTTWEKSTDAKQPNSERIYNYQQWNIILIESFIQLPH